MNLALILAVAIVLGRTCRKIHLPALIGEIGAGIVLGPTILGHLSNKGLAHTWLPLAIDLTPTIQSFVSFASAILLFYYGTTIVTKQLPGRRAVLKFAAWSVAIPILFGVVVGLSALHPSPISRLATALTFAVMFAISALPVIVRVFHDLDIHQTRFGTTIIAVASITDLLCWIMLSIVLGYFAPHTVRQSTWIFLTIYLLLLLGFIVLYRIFVWVERRHQQRATHDISSLGIALVAVLVGSWLAQRVGISGVIIAFLVGVTLVQSTSVSPGIVTWIRRLAVWVCGPIFFSIVGLKIDYAKNFQVGTVTLVIGLAYLTKMIAGWWGARSVGWPPRLRIAAGIALSARGAMDIIVATIALESALISPAIFEAFVVMAIITSITTYLVKPILQLSPN